MNEEKKKERQQRILSERQSKEHIKTGYLGVDSRKGRLEEIKTPNGVFRMKSNRKGE